MAVIKAAPVRALQNEVVPRAQRSSSEPFRGRAFFCLRCQSGSLVMDTRSLIAQYHHFFESRGHAHLPSAPLIPENDPTALFISAGMQPLVPFLLGEPHPAGR